MFRLVLVNLFRNKLRTVLTMASVTVALFLFCTLGGILDTLQESSRSAASPAWSCATRSRWCSGSPWPIASASRRCRE